jgi:hypothetical protein
VHEGIAAPQQAMGLEGEQFGVAGAGPHQRDERRIADLGRARWRRLIGQLTAQLSRQGTLSDGPAA